ncbi:MAG: O-antigen ligase family protein [Pseudomonadota bacterium]
MTSITGLEPAPKRVRKPVLGDPGLALSTVSRNLFGLLLAIGIVLGGGTQNGIWTDSLIELLLIPMVIWGAWHMSHSRLSVSVKILSVVILFVLLAQFLPFAPPLALPDFNGTASGQMFWSASPSRALEAFFFGVTCVGVFWFVGNLETREQIALLRFVFLAVGIHCMLAIVQLSYDSQSNFETVLPFTIRAGLFANENHFSTLLSMMIPLLAWRYAIVSRHLWAFLLVSILIAGLLFAAGSRAGMAFASSLVVLSLFWLQFRSLHPIVKLGVLAIVIVLGFTGLVFSDAEEAIQQDLRSLYFANTWEAIKDHWIFGTGLGTFVAVYPLYEAREEIVSVYANHAHNDYLELMLEGGLMFLIPMVSGAVLIVLRALKKNRMDVLALSLAPVLVHSIVDYPLRTFAVALVFSVLAAMVFSRRSPSDRFGY